MQPWSFFVATQDDPEAFAKLVACLNPSNAEWASHAPVLIMTVAKMTMSDGRPHAYAFHDIGLATQNLIVQATALDLHAHPMAGFSASKARELLAIPDGYDPVTMIAVGYLGDPDALPAQRREQELATAHASRCRNLSLPAHGPTLLPL